MTSKPPRHVDLPPWCACDPRWIPRVGHDRPVGFALVSRPPVNRRTEIDFRLAEFFVTASARRLGVGANAATLIFSRFAGRWEVIEFLRNTGAVAFWRNVIGKYTSGRFREAVANGEVRHVFQSTRS